MVSVPDANWIEACRPSCGKALVASPAKDSFGRATESNSPASVGFSELACTEMDNPSWFGESDLGEGEEVGEGDGDGD